MPVTIGHVKNVTIADGTDSNIVRPSDWNSAHAVTLNLSADEVIKYVQAGTTSVSSGTVSFANSNGVSFGLNTNGVITASVVEAGRVVSHLAYPPVMANTQTQNASASTFVVWPVRVDEGVTMNALRLARTVSFASSSFASTANTTFSFQQAETHRVVVYSRGSGASSLSLHSVASTSAGLTYSANAAYGSASNTNQFFTQGMTYPAIGGTGSFSTSYSTSNLSTLALSTGNWTRMSGFKFFDIPWATSMSEGDYWLAYNVQSASTTQATNLSGVRLQASHLGMSQPNLTAARFGEANNASVQLLPVIGSFTTAGGATTASLGFSNVSSSASHVQPYVTLGVMW